MSYLEQKRNALLNSVSGGLYNVLKDTTFSNGFINGSGDVQSATANKEQVTDFIDLGNNTAYILYTKVNSSSQKWYGIGCYDSNKNFITRLVGYDETAGGVLPTNTQYIRFSYRTYGDSQALANLFEVDKTDTIYVGD